MSRRRGPHVRRIVRRVRRKVNGEVRTVAYELDCSPVHHVQEVRRRSRGERPQRTGDYVTCAACSGQALESISTTPGRSGLPLIDVRAACRAAHRDPALFDALQGFCEASVEALRSERYGPWTLDIRDRLERLAGQAGLLSATPDPEEP